MPRSRGKRAPRKGSSSRLQTAGIFLTLLVVAALVGSAAWGLFGSKDEAAPVEPDEAPAAQRPTGRVRVEVLNASGRSGLARQATEVLRDRGFDVVEFGNAQGFGPDSSLVLDRVGNVDLARQVADAIGIRHVRSQPNADLYLDVTVVLGRDWTPPRPPR